MSQAPRSLISRHRPAPPAPVAANGPPPLPPRRPAGILPFIGMNMVQSIDDMSGGGMNPIWLVTMRGGGVKLVVKAEMELNPSEAAFAKANMKAMSDVMMVVSKTSAFARLEDKELTALDSFVTRPLTLRSAITAAQTGTKHLTKMKFDPSFFCTSAGEPIGMGFAAQAMSPEQQAKSILLFTALRNNREAWRTLGQVVFADAMIGNNDRVSFENGRVSNFGNLIFARDTGGNVTHALGYDTYHAFADNAKMMYGTAIHTQTAPMFDPRGEAEYSWIGSCGKWIKKEMLPRLAKGIIDSINKERMIPFNLAPYTVLEEQKHLLDGLLQGSRRQESNIKTKLRQGQGLPSGLVARAKYLDFAL